MEQVGRYRLLAEVGRGGMGIVYRATDTELGRTVAVNTLRLSEYATPQEVLGLRERLVREARAAALAFSLALHLHQVGRGTFIPKLLSIPSTQLNRSAVTGGLLLLRFGGTIAPPSIAIPAWPNVAAALEVQWYYRPNGSSAAYRLRGGDRRTFQNISGRF